MLYFLLNLNLRRYKSNAIGNQLILTKSWHMKSMWNKTKARDVYSYVLSAVETQYSECVASTFDKLKIYLRIYNYESNTQVKEENLKTTFSYLYYKESRK